MWFNNQWTLPFVMGQIRRNKTFWNLWHNHGLFSYQNPFYPYPWNSPSSLQGLGTPTWMEVFGCEKHTTHRCEYTPRIGKTKEQINWQRPSLLLLKHNKRKSYTKGNFSFYLQVVSATFTLNREGYILRKKPLVTAGKTFRKEEEYL